MCDYVYILHTLLISHKILVIDNIRTWLCSYIVREKSFQGEMFCGNISSIYIVVHNNIFDAL